jgi:hypothetical protein
MGGARIAMSSSLAVPMVTVEHAQTFDPKMQRHRDCMTMAWTLRGSAAA